MSIYRLTGTAEAVVERSGTSKPGTANEFHWTLREQPIRVNEFVVTSVNLQDGDKPFQVGQVVDCIVDVTTRGAYLQTAVRGEWPKPGLHSMQKPA